MATYTTSALVKIAVGGTSRLIELTDTDGNGREDTGVVTAAIDEAESLINSYVRKAGREVPLLAPIPPIIQTTCTQIAKYVLKRNRDALSEMDIEIHSLNLKWLADLAAKKVDLGVAVEPPASTHNPAAQTARDSDLKSVSRDNLKGFS